ncbi:MAG: M24 family metallopeptidase [Erysipelotrichaceae bacterium]
MHNINRLRTLMQEQQVDAVLLYSDHNRFYVSGFTGSTGAALVTLNNAYFLTDFRYFEQVKDQCLGFSLLKVEKENTYTSLINEVIETEQIHQLGLEGDFLTHLAWVDLEDKLNTQVVHFKTDLLRLIKSEEELSIMRQANEIAMEAYNYLLTQVQPGMQEMEVRNILEGKMMQLGASKASFDTIIASGHRGALPHGVASDKVIESTDLVTVDFGCVYHGYCSDITRTFAMSKQIDPKLLDIYETVRAAQQLALEACAPGKTTKEIDAIARNYIESKGYGAYFGHGLGHGLGILVHESPRLNWLSEVVLEEGMVITIEPGIYIAELGGVRIEDDVLITKTGYERLTTLPKTLHYIAN